MYLLSLFCAFGAAEQENMSVLHFLRLWPQEM